MQNFSSDDLDNFYTAIIERKTDAAIDFLKQYPEMVLEEDGEAFEHAAGGMKSALRARNPSEKTNEKVEQAEATFELIRDMTIYQAIINGRTDILDLVDGDKLSGSIFSPLTINGETINPDVCAKNCGNNTITTWLNKKGKEAEASLRSNSPFTLFSKPLEASKPLKEMSSNIANSASEAIIKAETRLEALASRA